MHVAGIAAANGENPDNTDSVVGVAPEAQLLDMKVFPNTNTVGPLSDVIIEAIEDSVKLDADVINMSLGSISTGASSISAEVEALDRAAEAGVIPVVAAGNDGNAGWMMNGGTENTTINDWTDDSTLASPAIAKNAITVASSENEKLDRSAITFSRDGEELFGGPLKMQMSTYTSTLKDLQFPTNKQIVVVPDKTTKLTGGDPIAKVADGDAGRGFLSDYDGLAVTGRIAVVSRGDNSFADKEKNALSAGAAGLIIINNATDGDADYEANLDDDGANIPTIYITHENGVKLLAEVRAHTSTKYQLSPVKYVVDDNADYGKMSSYSTWGPSSDLSAKPDITAPGGHLWSLANNNKYQDMSGTSMASPVVAGAETLIAQHLKATTSLSGLDLVNTAKLMSQNTATPLTDPDHDNAPYSPRLQGAGNIQIANAVANNVALSYEDGTGAAALGELNGRSQTFTVTLTNNGSTTANYKYNDFGGVYTKAIDDTKVTYDTKIAGATMTADQQTISIAAGKTATVKVTLTLPSTFKNDQWAEGFIGFTSQDGQPDLSMPVTSFFGDWDNLQSQTLFDGVAGHDDSTYNLNFLQDSYGDILGLDFDYSTYQNMAADGSFGDALADYPAYVNEDKVAISPNGDEYRDVASPYLMTNRNVKKLTEYITDESGKTVRTLNTENNTTRHYVTNRGEEVTINNSISFSAGTFDGSKYDTKTGVMAQLPEGQYYYNVTATPDTKDPQPETIKMPVKIDVTNPVFKNVQLVKKADGYHVTGTVTDNLSGLNNYSAIGISVNGASDSAAYHLDNSASLADYINQDPKADQLLTSKKFDLTLHSSLNKYLETGKNEIILSIQDNADNLTQSKFALSADTNQSGSQLILYNVYDGENESANSSSYYDAKTGTYTLYGYFTRDFYINGQLVTINDDGTFTAHIKLEPSTKELVFSLDNKQVRVIKKIAFNWAVLPSVTLEKSGATRTYYNGQYIQMYTNSAPYFVVNGSVDDQAGTTFDGVGGVFDAEIFANYQASPQNFEFNLDKDTNKFNATFKMVGTDPSTSGLSAEELLSSYDTGYPGDNIISAYAYSGEFGSDEELDGLSDSILVRQTGTTDSVKFNNITDAGMVQYTGKNAAANGYDADKGVFVVKGVVNTDALKDFVILGHSNDPDDPLNKPTLTTDQAGNTTFTYDLKMGATEDRFVTYEYTSKATGEIAEGNFGVALDTVFPQLYTDDGDTWQVSTKKGVDYEIWTNKDTYTLSGWGNDDLSGYTLYINGDEEYHDPTDGALIAKFSGHDKYNFSKTLPLTDFDGDHYFQLALYDSYQNMTAATLLVHHSTAKPAAPKVKASTTKITNKPVLLSATQAQKAQIQFSLDNGKTWSDYSNGVIKGLNGDVQFKATDKYGNESDVVTYHVTNVFPLIAATPTASLSDLAQDSATVTLGYDKTMTETAAAMTHLQYSLDGGQTWLTYSEPFKVTETTDIKARTIDDAGNVSKVKNVHVALPTATQTVAAPVQPATEASATTKAKTAPTEATIAKKTTAAPLTVAQPAATAGTASARSTTSASLMPAGMDIMAIVGHATGSLTTGAANVAAATAARAAQKASTTKTSKAKATAAKTASATKADTGLLTEKADQVAVAAIGLGAAIVGGAAVMMMRLKRKDETNEKD